MIKYIIADTIRGIIFLLANMLISPLIALLSISRNNQVMKRWRAKIEAHSFVFKYTKPMPYSEIGLSVSHKSIFFDIFSSHKTHAKGSVLVIGPYTGSHGIICHDIVKVMQKDCSIHLVNWKDVKHLPASLDVMGFNDAVLSIKEILRNIGEPVHVICVSSASLVALSCVALIKDDRIKPLSLIMISGNINAKGKSIGAFDKVLSSLSELDKKLLTQELINVSDRKIKKNKLHFTVPFYYQGRGRSVLPGIIIQCLFFYLNKKRKRKFLIHYMQDDDLVCNQIKLFFSNYLPSIDIPYAYYEDINFIMKQNLLYDSRLKIYNERVDLSLIDKTKVLTIEGQLDEICSPGQTSDVLNELIGLPPHMKSSYIHAYADHAALYSGPFFYLDIARCIKSFIADE